MVADPAAADHVRLMFEMYAEPETSFGDITRYFEEQGIKIYEKSMVRTFLSQLLRNPVYAQADLELYEFFKSQGAAIVNDASDFAGTNGCYLYQGRDVKEDKDRCLKDQILVIAPHEATDPLGHMAEMQKKANDKHHLPAGPETEKHKAGRKNQMRALRVCAESHPCTKQNRIFPLHQTDRKQRLSGLRENPQRRI